MKNRFGNIAASDYSESRFATIHNANAMRIVVVSTDARGALSVLKLFANFFGYSNDDPRQIPESLVKEATERVVDGTDARLRIVAHYAKALREPVTRSLHYVVELVARIPAPVVADRHALNDDPAFAALFYSGERLQQILSRDLALKGFFAANPSASGPATALLVAERTEKRGFGYAQVDGQARSDVPRTTVSFSNHRLLEPAASEQETRRLLRRRAFDHLVSVALQRVTQRREKRDDLAVREALLRSKLAILRRGSGFARHTDGQGQVELQARLDEVEAQLSTLGSAGDTLSANLIDVASVLEEPERHLWIEDTTLCLDKFYVLHDSPGPGAPATVFREVHDSDSRQVTVLLVNIPTRERP